VRVRSDEAHVWPLVAAARQRARSRTSWLRVRASACERTNAMVELTTRVDEFTTRT
jgi:hypothetical protein